jgi:anthranilate synthase component 1
MDVKILLEKKKFLLKEKKIQNKILIDSLTEELPNNHIKNINKILKYIKAGDVFQVNLSREWHGKINNKYSACDIFSKLKKTNPSPFSGLVTYKNKAIISSSPERLIRVKNGHIETRPIAGTRGRGGSGIYDVALSKDLLNNKKERAEHIMLVDLERNDLSKVTVKGSVKVNELMIVESYAHVHHIVSNVTGRVKKNTTPGKIIEAVFPGGTITGCPKVRCMEILSEIEKTGRGPYTGSIGYINNDGSMDLNILIRTIVKDNNNVSIRAGGVIVADSIPKRELEEARAKAKGMINALI